MSNTPPVNPSGQQYQQPMPRHHQQSGWGQQQPMQNNFNDGMGGLGSILNLGLLGLLNGKNPLYHPGSMLTGLLGQMGQQQLPQYQRPWAPPPEWQQQQYNQTPPIVPSKQPGQGV